MAKKTGVPNRHIYSRISFLYQAAAYLAEAGKETPKTANQRDTAPSTRAAAIADVPMEDANDNAETQEDHSVKGQNMSRKMLTDLRSVTQKAVIRISPDMKRTICKYCDTLLIEGQTSSSAVENQSKGGKKPWADVLVIKCHTCGGEKRFPVKSQRQKRRPHRVAAQEPKQERGT